MKTDKPINLDIPATLNLDNFITDIQDVKIFGGVFDGLQRTDRYKYPISKKLYEALENAAWFPKEISFAKDKVALTNMRDVHTTMYKQTLIFQTFADSLANRFLDGVLVKHVTSPEWEALLKIQGYQELNHSRAYSHNIRECYEDTEAFFNEGLQDEYIVDRLKAEIKSYNHLADVKLIKTDEDKLILIETLYRQYALECVRFQVSFLISFLIDDLYEHALQGTTNNNKLILNDEFSHTVIFATLIKILKNNEDEGFSHLMHKVDVEEIFKEVIASEIDWFRYLTKDNSLQGATIEDVTTFLNNLGAKALNNINEDHGLVTVKPHGLTSYFNDTSSINNGKALAQETDILSYNVGMIKESNKTASDIKSELEQMLNEINL